jgi:hypothetical protein
MEPNYAGSDFSNRQVVENEFNCIDLCHINPTCVLAVHYPDNGTCILQDNLNVFDGMFHSEDSSIYNLFLDFYESSIDNLLPNNYYSMKLKGLTPYGSLVESNEVIFFSRNTFSSPSRSFLKLNFIFINLKLIINQ